MTSLVYNIDGRTYPSILVRWIGNSLNTHDRERIEPFVVFFGLIYFYMFVGEMI